MNINKASNLAIRLIEQHGLSDWSFEMRPRRKTFGLCEDDIRMISLSKKLTHLNDEMIVRDVILHEIAHALVGCWHDHDSVWQDKCKSLGANPIQFYSSVDIDCGLRKSAMIHGKRYNRGDRIRLYSRKLGLKEGVFWGYNPSNPKFRVFVKCGDSTRLVKCPERCVMDPNNQTPMTIGNYMCNWLSEQVAFVGKPLGDAYQVLKLNKNGNCWNVCDLNDQVHVKNISYKNMANTLDVYISDGDIRETFPTS